MRTDLYTKLMLTIIAACLVWLCLGGPSVLTPLRAQNANRVYLAGWVDDGGYDKRFPNNPLPVSTQR